VKAYQTKSAKPKGIPGLPPSQPVVVKPSKKEVKTEKLPSGSSSSSASTSTSDALKLDKLTIGSTTAEIPSNTNASADASVDIDKKIKGLKKKLRDIEELAKKDQTQLNPEQLEKLSKRTGLENEITALESSQSK
jgi:hypothetical protein